GQKRPGPEYLHYLCAVYRADPPDLGYPDPCFCGRGHGEERPAPAGPDAPAPGEPAGRPPAASGHPAADPGPGPTVVGRRAPRLAFAGAAGSLILADADPEDDDDVVHRMLLRLIADPTAAVDGQFFGAIDRIRRRMDDALVCGTVSAIMLDEWEEATVG